MNRDQVVGLLGILCVVALLGGLVAYNVTLWQECRSIHSFMYCMHTLSK